jgi:ERG8-type phosphomevalonate kinase
VPLLIEADAPGKLVIVGEYAVLEGAQGLAVAVDVRALARVTSVSGSGNQLVIPDTGESFRFRWMPATGPRWEGNSPGAFGLPLEACAEILAARGLLPLASDLPACRIELTTAAFHQTSSDGQRVKLGLGSSAAVIVVLTGALVRFAGVPALPQQELIAICCEAHRRLQGGNGSGIDIATAITGGAVAIDFSSRTGPGLSVPRVHPVSWPSGLSLVAVWSGQSTSTPAMLDRLRAFRARDAARSLSHMERLGAVAGQAVAAWRAQDLGSLLSAIAEYESGLRLLDEAAGIGIFSPVHEQLRAIALEHGAVYKPSGAGGGDFGIALTDSPEVEQALREGYAARGFEVLNEELCAPGLSVRGAASRARLRQLG